MRLLRYICQLQRKASYLCWTSFFRKLIQCILYVGFKTSITGAYICWKPFIYRHSPYQFPYIWYMHVAIFTPHTTQPEWMAQYSLLCLSACIYITLFYMHFLFVCLFVCLKWAEQYIWSFFWCGIAACIWWFHGDWGMVTLHVLQHMKSKAAKQWGSGRLINGLKKVRGNEEEALQTMWRSQRMILPFCIIKCQIIHLTPPKWIYGWVTENIKSWAHSFCCNFMKLTMCAEKNVRLILFTAHRGCSISWKLVF